MITYPEQPWSDGQTFVHTTKEGDEITGVYDLPNDTWSFYAGNTLDAVFTNNVYTVDIRPADQSIAAAAAQFNDSLPLPGVDSLVTQQDVNWYLYDLINRIDTGGNIWNDIVPPPESELGEPLFTFWWKPDEEQLYVWDPNKSEWVLTGVMDFDRPPIIGSVEPIEHPKFPGEPLQEGDFWIDNHEGRAFTTMYYWTGTEWEEIEDAENFDEDLKMHTCAQFYKKVSNYTDVEAKEGHFAACYDFGNNSIKWWTSPSQKGFYNNGDKIWVNDQGPYILEQLADVGKWTTFYLPDSPQPPNGTVVKFSKIPKLCDTSFNDDRYVNKTGDTMTGNLVMDDSSIVMVDGPLDFVRSAESLKDVNDDPILNASGEEQWDPNAERFSKIESYPPRLIKSDGTYSGDTSTAFGIRVEIDDGNTFKNQFKVGNRNGDAVTIAGGTGPAVTFGSGFPGNQDKVAPGDEGKIRIKGIPTPDYDTAEGDVAVNKRYVDERDEVLLQNIVELEEEIDAIAPSVERGKWKFTAVGTVAQPGQFTMYDAEFGSGNPTGLFKSAKSIWFNEVDTDGVTHAFGDVDDGELLEIFVEGAPEYGLYEVVGQAHDETVGATSFWVIDVNFVRTIEDTAAVAPNEICRFKVFMAPTGGDASGFVMKTGDTMSGQLKFYTEQADDSFDYRVPTDGSKDIRFTTKRLDLGFENTTSLYKPGYTDTLVCSGALMSKSSLYTSSYLYGIIFKNDGTRVTKAPRIYFNRTVDSNDNVTDEFGALRWNGTNILRWKDTEITIDKPINITNNALATDDQHAIHRGYVDKVARMAGLQLGRYLYRRNSDNWVAGSIKSNTSTNPAAITKLSIYKNNHDGITFGASFLANLIVPGMFLHFMEKQEGIYCGKITDVSIITNGVEVILEPFTSLISGGVYLNNPYDVLISYNRYGIKFPQ